tara:strand:- start:541 stop:1485 length:945 start_codon:yes stop_codon:yes gene_type:complete
MKCPPITKVLIFVCYLLAPLTEANAISNCFSFIPYATNGSFVQLPEDKEFCFHYSGKTTQMSTNHLGGRVIKGNQLNDGIIAFGESQLLGLDISDYTKSAKHELSELFSSVPLIIYAAPNNGPLQALRQMKRVHDIDPISNKAIVIGFNYGTDIFRIQKHWDPKKFVPLDMTQLERSFKIPGYHDITLFIARLRGVKFGSTVSNSEMIRKFYSKLTDQRRNQDIDNWLSQLKNSELRLASSKNFILYPPYWNVGANEMFQKKVEKDYFALACKVFKTDLFDRLLVSEMPSKNTKFASDNRHFLSSALTYQEYSC